MKIRKNPDLSRAEKVRQRRSKEDRDKLKKYKNRKRSFSYEPGVTVRGESYGTPVIRRTRSRMRRKFTLTLGSGVELLLPSVPVFRPGWRLLSGPIFILLGVLIYLMLNTPELRVSQPEIIGAQRINPADVEALIDINNEPIFFIDPGAIQVELVSSYPEFTSVDVEIVLPASVVIRVMEREPLFAWEFDDNILWIDTFGSIFPARGEADILFTIKADGPPPLLITKPVESLIFTEDENETEDSEVEYGYGLQSLNGKHIDSNVLDAAVKMKYAIPELKNLAYNRQDGLGWIDPNGWKVFFGITMENMETKLQMYKAIVSYLDNEGLEPSMISVAHVHAPFYRLD